MKVKHYFFVINLIFYLFASKEILSLWLHSFSLIVMLSVFFSTFVAILTDKLYDRFKLFVAIPFNLTIVLSLIFAVNYYSRDLVNERVVLEIQDLVERKWVAIEEDLECQVQFFENDSVTFLYSKGDAHFSYIYKLEGDKIFFFDFDEFDDDVFFEWEVKSYSVRNMNIIEDGDISLNFSAQPKF